MRGRRQSYDVLYLYVAVSRVIFDSSQKWFNKCRLYPHVRNAEGEKLRKLYEWVCSSYTTRKVRLKISSNLKSVDGCALMWGMPKTIILGDSTSECALAVWRIRFEVDSDLKIVWWCPHVRLMWGTPKTRNLGNSASICALAVSREYFDSKSTVIQDVDCCVPMWGRPNTRSLGNSTSEYSTSECALGSSCLERNLTPSEQWFQKWTVVSSCLECRKRDFQEIWRLCSSCITGEIRLKVDRDFKTGWQCPHVSNAEHEKFRKLYEWVWSSCITREIRFKVDSDFKSGWLGPHVRNAENEKCGKVLRTSCSVTLSRVEFDSKSTVI